MGTLYFISPLFPLSSTDNPTHDVLELEDTATTKQGPVATNGVTTERQPS